MELPRGGQILLDSITGRWGIAEVFAEINSFTSMILLLYFFPPGLLGERTFHFTEVKTGSVSGMTFFFLKKEKIRNQLLDMQS